MYLSASSLVVGGLLLAQLNISPSWSGTGRPALVLCSIATVAAAGLVIASLSLPRRPNVFFKGRIVDRMYTVSGYGRLTYSWGPDLMKVARKKGDLDLKDLPHLSHRVRPDEQSARWESRKIKDTVFKSLLRIYGASVLKQWIAAIANTGISYLPWLITLRLLETLESRKAGEVDRARLWLLLVWLGIAKLGGVVRNIPYTLCAMVRRN